MVRALFASEHEQFRDTVRRFLAREVVPFHADWEREGQVPRELWRKAGATGLLGCSVPPEYGGSGGDWLYEAVVIEELARTGCTGPAFTLQSQMVMPYLLEFGSQAQREQWLPRLAVGEVIGALALTEPQ